MGTIRFLVAAALVAPSLALQDLRTVAEASEWQATATHDQVMEWCRALSESSPRVHMEVAGETPEGRSLSGRRQPQRAQVQQVALEAQRRAGGDEHLAGGKIYATDARDLIIVPATGGLDLPGE